jgi:hypothetical protein
MFAGLSNSHRELPANCGGQVGQLVTQLQANWRDLDVPSVIFTIMSLIYTSTISETENLDLGGGASSPELATHCLRDLPFP